MTSHTNPERFSLDERVVGRRQDGDPVIRLEIYGILILAFAMALALALATFDPADVGPGAASRSQPTANAIGPIGAHVANLFLGGFGVGAWFFTAVLGWLGVSYLIGRRAHIQRLDVFGWLGALACLSVLTHVAMTPAQVLGHSPGGLVGEYAGEVMRALLSTPGTLIVALTGLVVSLIALTRRSIFELGVLAGRGAKAAVRWAQGLMRMGDDAADVAVDDATDEARARGDAAKPSRPRPPRRAKTAKAEAKGQEPDAEAAAEGSEAGGGDDGPTIVAPRISALVAEAADAQPAEAPAAPERQEAPASRAAPAKDASAEDGPRIVEPPPRRAPGERHATEDFGAAAAAEPPPVATPAGAAPAGAALAGEPVAAPAAPTPAQTAQPSASQPPEGGGSDGVAPKDDAKIVESAAMRRSRELVVGDQLPLVSDAVDKRPYILPGLALLDYKAPSGRTYDRDLLRDNAQILEQKLGDYGVKGKVVEIHPGPVITMYEFRPAAGVKISKIANLSDDLAMALSALAIRIVAPIPGKDVVGIEVPNKSREVVWLKEILSDPLYTKAKSKLTLALGKDIVGNPAVMNLAKAPHLLVAGATGSGKSVAINSFICSMLYAASPDDVRMIMIDPKMIELSIYEGIPHLLLPVVTDPSQAATALRWAVKEMERRYRLLADLGVRNLANYNAKVEALESDPAQQLPERLRLAKIKREAAGDDDPEGVVLGVDGQPLDKLPAIVVVVDEFADLMMVASKDVELCVARLAQKARAAGIHVILATQRPSVDVITGMIKANFPTRIAFRVASKVDSRTILDQKGAEALLGMGDMLYLPPGSSSVRRVHGNFVSEEEVHAIVAHLKTQGRPDYDLGILTSDDEDAGGPSTPRGDDYDELYDQALRIVAETRNASISFLQRKLKIGYNRAARIVEKLEEEGIVGPSDGTSRPREVFIDPI